MDLNELFVPILALRRKETKPMADYLAEGGEITPAIRAALIDFLRDPRPGKRSKRTYAQKSVEAEIVMAFIALHHMGGLVRAEAIRQILEMEPNLTQSTVENYLRNFFGKSER